jgi:hypothetical protein
MLRIATENMNNKVMPEFQDCLIGFIGSIGSSPDRLRLNLFVRWRQWLESQDLSGKTNQTNKTN